MSSSRISSTSTLLGSVFSEKVWGSLAVGALAITWLIPNHYFPWLSFHNEAWMAVWAALACTWVLLRFGVSGRTPMPALALLALSALPWIQYWSGLIPAPGQAWISSVYLLGAGVCVAAGWTSQMNRPKQLINLIAIGVVASGCISVAIQLIQWMNIYSEDPISWFSLLIFPIHESARPLANIGQPNQLATLLASGIVCAVWLYGQNIIKMPGAVAIVIALSLGLSLTQSRVGILQLIALLALALVYRKLWQTPKFLRLFALALVLRVVFHFVMPLIANALALDKPWRSIEQMAVNSDRWMIWVASLELLLAQPITGYGWRSLLEPLTHTSALGYLGHPHNILLDLLLWCGIPLGLLIILLSGGLLARLMMRIGHSEQVPVFMLIAVMLVHALVEFPHQYFHLLLIPCFALGVLLAMIDSSPSAPTGTNTKPTGVKPSLDWLLGTFRTTGAVIIMSLTLAWGSAYFLIGEYLRIEDHTRRILLLSHNNVPLYSYDTPPMFALSHMSNVLEVSIMRPSQKYSLDTLIWMENVTAAETSQQAHFNLAASLALAGYRDRARYLVWTLAKSSSTNAWNLYKQRWEFLQQQNPQLGDLAWPQNEDLIAKPTLGRERISLRQASQ